jgi:hypothetical protein
MGKNQDPGSGINISDPQHCGMGKKSGSGIKKEIGSGIRVGEKSDLEKNIPDRQHWLCTVGKRSINIKFLY